MAQAPTQSINQEFAEKFAGSLAMQRRAQQVIAGGMNHDGRFVMPFPPYISHAQGAYKWDVDDNQILDYVMGHGSLLLGHNDPDILAAMQAKLGHGTHLGACSPHELEWAEEVQRLVPNAERVRFTGSGTESTLLAIRIARSATGKKMVLKFEGHFHGWNDYLLKAEKPPFDAPFSPGIPEETWDTVAVLPANDPAALEARLAKGDIAAVIMEATGGSWATMPMNPGFPQEVRDLCTKHGALLIFDEVITGFRWAPGGAQQSTGVTPDLATFAKIIAGGMPGGAVTGTADAMAVLEFRSTPGWNATKKVRHQGTFNAQPVAAAAGTTCLQKVADGETQRYCDALASNFRAGLNGVLERRNLPGFAWGDSSVFHIALGLTCTNRTAGDLRAPEGPTPLELKVSDSSAANQLLYPAMLLEGIELFHGGGLVSRSHTQADIDRTVDAFDRVLGRLEAEGVI